MENDAIAIEKLKKEFDWLKYIHDRRRFQIRIDVKGFSRYSEQCIENKIIHCTHLILNSAYWNSISFKSFETSDWTGGHNIREMDNVVISQLLNQKEEIDEQAKEIMSVVFDKSKITKDLIRIFGRKLVLERL